MFGILNHTGARILAVAGLAIGLSVICFAQSTNTTSIVSALDNQNAVSNTAVSSENVKGGGDGGKSEGGGGGGKTGGDGGGKTGGGDGGHTGGGDGGNGGNGGPPCVPEPMSMLALGIGSGVVFLKKRAAKKA